MGDEEVGRSKCEMILKAKSSGDITLWVSRFPFEEDNNFYTFTAILLTEYTLTDCYNEPVDLTNTFPWLTTGYNILFFAFLFFSGFILCFAQNVLTRDFYFRSLI